MNSYQDWFDSMDQRFQDLMNKVDAILQEAKVEVDQMVSDEPRSRDFTLGQFIADSRNDETVFVES